MPRKLGSGMRGMKNRQLGREKRTDDAGSKPRDEERAEMPDLDEEVEEPLDDGVLVDQGDGTRVLRRVPRRSREDEDSHECPDEPPKGWGEG